MRNIFLATLGLLALLTAGAVAGDYHYKTQLNCPECHIMHASQSHGYNTNGGGLNTPHTATPNGRLLRDEVNKLCLSCHDNQTLAPDVFLENGGTPQAYGRMAGALNEVGNGTPYYEATGHTLGSPDAAPGGTTYVPDAAGLECTNCHGAHGNANYRNLGAHGATVAVTYTAGGSADVTKDVWEHAANSYGTHDVDFLEPVSNKSAYADFCKVCHTKFHGDITSSDMALADSTWVRHPTADVNIRMTGSTGSARQFAKVLYRTKVMSPTGNWGTQGTALGAATTLTSLTPSCFSCHKGHGSSHAFGLIYMTGAAEPGEDGDGVAMRETCHQCHSQGV